MERKNRSLIVIVALAVSFILTATGLILAGSSAASAGPQSPGTHFYGMAPMTHFYG